MTKEKALQQALVLRGLELDYTDTDISDLVQDIYTDFHTSLDKVLEAIKYTNDKPLIVRTLLKLKDEL